MADKQVADKMTPAMINDWLVYIIETSQGKLYTGITNNLQRRVSQHASGRGAKFFRLDPPRRVLWVESEHTRASATRREAAIKKLSRRKKLGLIAMAEGEPIRIAAPNDTQ